TASPTSTKSLSGNYDGLNVFTLKNHFNALRGHDVVLSENVLGESSGGNGNTCMFGELDPSNMDSKSEVDEAYVEYVTNVIDPKGASTSSNDSFNV
ncbi:hypothetical protein Tco_0483706, partial [Tanacetum coccineum]